ncbi:MAG: tRNA1(Val) (adenine(37)-N6)-methyltransferase [Clostridia bacterium]|jgi:tRNA1(Val) A37 N6-methylase TrmN6|nr:tRNA1(Val) (adenine(37)-N6)-methyltransferase [Clostridia bacterium]MCI2014510.1 tRNA1(Val) (adenine(37)-N6)-methyltransferase [Clostridia bacterium]
MKKVEINDFERVDDLHRNGYMLIQDPKRFCFGVDAVLLSDFAKAQKGEKVLDLGTGTGVIPILMEAKSKAEHFFALEIQEESAEMARRSVELNGLSEKIDIITGDIKNADDIFPLSSFDVITTNPPYMENGGGLKNGFTPKAIARHEVLCSLDDIARVSSRLLKFGGRFYMVHRPYRIADIMCILRKYKLEPKIMRLVHPYADREPNMVLIEAVRSGKPMLKVMPPLIIYKDDKTYTDEIIKIYYE